MLKLRNITSAVLLASATALPLPALADSPGAGITARFEVAFLQFTIDHHFSALRMTELAAGTDLQRNPELSAAEGTSPTPGFAATPPKASLNDVKSMARRANRAQREEIMSLQTMLKEWYGIHYEPKLRADGQLLINILERAHPGADFDHLFLETFSRHHYTLMEPVNACMTGTDLEHLELRRECQGMWHMQVAEIDMMRHELKKHFGIEDYQPFNGIQPMHGIGGNPRGNHTGGH